MNAVRSPQRRRFATFSAIVLAFTVLVILWGAWVRVSGSGAGCGSHWPTCNGEVLPQAPSTKTLIELTHRITSSVSYFLVVAQLVWSFKVFERGHAGRRAAAWSLFFMTTEALVGAGIVVFEKVAHDKSLARGWWMSAHLANTFMLLGTMGLVVWLAYNKTALPSRWSLFGSLRGKPKWLLLGGIAAVLVTGITGAIAALGDTLFPSKTFAEGFAQDLSSQAHVFLQLRALHPFAAVLTAVYLIVVGASFARHSPDARTQSTARALGFLVVVQVLVGLVNLLLAAPAAMQLVHLLVADAVWLALIALAASVAASSSEPAARPQDARNAVATS